MAVTADHRAHQWAAIWADGDTDFTFELAESRAEAIAAAKRLVANEERRGGLTFLARVYPPGDRGRKTIVGSLTRCARPAGTTSSSSNPTKPRSSSSRSAKRRAKRERTRTNSSKLS